MIRTKVLLVGLVPMTLGLLLACSIYVFTERREYTEELIRRLEVQALIVGSHVDEAVARGDATAAQGLLRTLGADPNLVRAVVYGPDARPLASYDFAARAEVADSPRVQADVTRADDAGIAVFRPVFHEGAKVGTVYLESGLGPLAARLRRYWRLTLLVFGVATLLAVAIAIFLRRWIADPLQGVASSLQAIAEGDADLTRRLRVDTRDEVGAVAHWFNTFVEAQQNHVRLIAGNARLLGVASDRLAQVSEQMGATAEESSGQASVASGASEQVSANLRTVATAAEQLDRSVRDIALNAVEAAQVADDAVAQAESAGSTVSSLGESGREIGDVIRMINNIAEQTNLLALNATIEAARAGEAGRGFAVVANEVKELARETAAATTSIGNRIQALQAGTAEAVEVIRRTGAVIRRIHEIQAAIATAVDAASTANEIRRSVAQAARGSAEITTGIGAVAEATGMTAAAVKETRHAAGELARMAAELESIVGRLRYDEHGDRVAVEVARAAEEEWRAQGVAT